VVSMLPAVIEFIRERRRAMSGERVPS